MPISTDFLPAERLPHSEILLQSEHIGTSSVLVAMLDTVPGMVAILNPQRQIIFCNESCAKAGGLTRKEDALGMRPGELLHCVHVTEKSGGCGTTQSCHYCGLAQALVAAQRGRATSGECLLHGTDQNKETSAEYAVEASPLPQLGDGWQCYSLTDISNEKRREALEHSFFHDISNLAGAVEGVSGILADEDISPDERAHLVRILFVSARALAEEIRSQRTLLAAEKGALAVGSAECDSLAALQEAVASCHAFGYADRKEIAILPEAQSVLLDTDAALLGRVLINLIKNALEASNAGMTVTAACAVPAPGRVRFSVHNDTVMPDQVRAHVFQRSFTTKGPGRGLGTYSVKLLTESYLGGRVWFESAPGHGTTFHAEFNL